MARVDLSFSRHPRTLGDNRYVYAVLSRRARGISVGINLNPDKICNFDCIYCQVDRTTPPTLREVDEAVLLDELESVLTRANDGSLYEAPPFAALPPSRRGLSDISFAGDGEPTTYPRFREVVAAVIALKRQLGLGSLKISVLSNCTVLDRPAVKEALELLDRSNGELWAKLDAGTEAYYRTIDRTKIPLKRVLANILAAARARPVVIQSLLLCLNGQGPSELEVEAYCRRLGEIVAAGGQIATVQLYTVARTPAVAEVGPLPNEELERLGEIIRRRVGITVDIYNAAMAVP
jgi:wyosine [tRNA(Phe)-imidazoG37] synthetase (radical SAM superfamily)